MTINDLIKELREAETVHGNIEVFYWSGACAYDMDTFVGIHRTGTRFFIAAAGGVPFRPEVDHAK